MKGIAQGCLEVGCALSGGETAEMPGMYQAGHYDLAGFSVGAVRPSQLLPKNDDMRPGDCLIGLPSSGIHSNGFSLVRHVLSKIGVEFTAPPPFPSDKERLCDVLLEPTRLYVKQCLKVMRAGLVNAAVHITGGGFVENVPRVLPDHLGADLDMATWEVPPVFQWLVKEGQIPPHEALRTFNCGIGMILVVPKEKADEVIKQLAELSQPSACIGTLKAFDGSNADEERVTISNISFEPRDDDKPKEECGVFG